MLKRTIQLVAATIFCIELSATALAQNANVEVQLNARMVVTQNGKESLQPADAAKPGDIIDYRAIYSNRGTTTAKLVMATLPIPAGAMTYLPNSAQPTAVLASTDGHTFAPLPLLRNVLRADGRTEQQIVPLVEYRFLRWQLGDLAAGKSAVVGARMQVIGAVGSKPEDAIPGAQQ